MEQRNTNYSPEFININNLSKEQRDELMFRLKFKESEDKISDRQERLVEKQEKALKEERKEKKERRSFFFKTALTAVLVFAAFNLIGGIFNTAKFTEVTGLTPTEMHRRTLQIASERTAQYEASGVEDIADLMQVADDIVYIPAP